VNLVNVRRRRMIGNKLKLATVLGIAAAIALSAASAEARGRNNAASARGAVVGDPYAYQPSGQPSGPYAYEPSGPFAYEPPSYPGAYQPSNRNAYGYIDDEAGYSGTGTFSDGRRVPGTNWNPNQN
jgi:hypothetical protein